MTKRSEFQHRVLEFNASTLSRLASAMQDASPFPRWPVIST
jgi:hypothetical protein